VADSDAALVDALRAGDEAAFVSLVRQYHPRLLRFAETLVPTRAVAEEVVQDTWLGVVKGIHKFEGRSSVRTWLFRVLVNRARSAGAREPRNVRLEPEDSLDGRFGADGHWSHSPETWSDRVDSKLAAHHLAERVRACLPQLPAAQRQVIMLRDLEGLNAAETCDLLGLSVANQRVLLHRARSRVRSILEVELRGS
jgi:RNA polymerase sigma-70 factor (ECF subfamily)